MPIRWRRHGGSVLSGLTHADVMGLRWCDVDLDEGTSNVRVGRVVLDHGDHIDEP
jgi:integrase